MENIFFLKTAVLSVLNFTPRRNRPKMLGFFLKLNNCLVLKTDLKLKF